MAKTKKAEATKRLIYESAIHLFTKHGYDAVSIQKIADHAGTAKGSFYSYYTTKSDIIVEKFWEIDAYYRSIEEVVRQERGGERRLLTFTELQLTYVRDVVGCDVLKVLYANQVLQEGSQKTITDETRFWFTFIEEIIAEAQRSGEFNSHESASTYARFFNRVIRGLFLDWNISSASFDLVEVGMHYCSSILIEALKRKN
ncbi:MAG: TetR/AcrR family transcriptional regulator [Sphaerochaeta sp.]|nr:TetR/AcrR family transcriptional regulator [Sphaerochaeta sp.]